MDKLLKIKEIFCGKEINSYLCIQFVGNWPINQLT